MGKSMVYSINRVNRRGTWITLAVIAMLCVTLTKGSGNEGVGAQLDKVDQLHRAHIERKDTFGNHDVSDCATCDRFYIRKMKITRAAWARAGIHKDYPW